MRLSKDTAADPVHRPAQKIRILRNASVLLAGQAALIVGSSLTTLALARRMGAERFGEYSGALAFVGLFLPVATLGLDVLLVREMVQKKDQAPMILGSGLILRLIGSGIAMALCIATSFWLDYTSQQRLLIGLWSFSLVATAGQLFQTPFFVNLANARPIAVSATFSLAGTLLKFGLIVSGISLTAYVLVDLLLTLLISLALWGISHKYSGVRAKWKPDWHVIRTLVAGCLPILVTSVFIAAYQRIDQQLLLAWKGPGELGHYAAAVRLAELLALLPVFLMRSAFPIISKGADSEANQLQISATCYRYLFLAIFPAVLLGAVFSPVLIRLAYGSEYAPAARALPWLLLAELPVVAGVVYGHFSLAANLQKFDMAFTFTNALATVALCVALIPAYGLVGAAIASLVGYAVSIPLQCLFRSTRRYSLVLMREALRVLAVGAVSWAAFVAAGYLVPDAIAVVIAALVFLGTAIPARLITREDLRFLNSVSH